MIWKTTSKQFWWTLPYKEKHFAGLKKHCRNCECCPMSFFCPSTPFIHHIIGNTSWDSCNHGTDLIKSWNGDRDLPYVSLHRVGVRSRYKRQNRDTGPIAWFHRDKAKVFDWKQLHISVAMRQMMFKCVVDILLAKYWWNKISICICQPQSRGEYISKILFVHNPWQWLCTRILLCMVAG